MTGKNGIAMSLKNMVFALCAFMFTHVAWAQTAELPVAVTAPMTLSAVGPGKAFKAEGPVGAEGVVYWDSEGTGVHRIRDGVATALLPHVRSTTYRMVVSRLHASLRCRDFCNPERYREARGN